MFKTVFSQKAQAYQNSRPKYPELIFEYLSSSIEKEATIVEFGCGTGIFTSNILYLGYRVIAVEPCDQMRQICEQRFRECQRIKYISESAEQANFHGEEIAAYIFPQSLHWMNIPKVKENILKQGGTPKIFTIWNARKRNGTESAVAYEKIISEYQKHQNKMPIIIDPLILLNELYGENEFRIAKIYHEHRLSNTGINELFSSIYRTIQGAALEIAKEKLNDWFWQYQNNGMVTLHYDCFMAISK